MANKILTCMLERLFAGLVNGPNLNCRPHASRQRVDFCQLAKLQDLAPEEVLGQLLGDDKTTLTARAAPPAKKSTSKFPDKSAATGRPEADLADEDVLDPAARAIEQAWSEQQAVLGKLRTLADEARTYEQDTGAHVLNIGLPLLSLPPRSLGLGRSRGAAGKRILAPIAFIPVEITIRAGPAPSVEIACQQDGVDAIIPNTALLAWLEQQTGQAVADAADHPTGGRWQALARLVEQVARILKLDVPEPFADLVKQSGKPKPWRLRPPPRSDDEENRAAVVPAAVLGLFPLNNQGLLCDTQAMLAEEKQDGPVASFLDARVSLEQPAPAAYDHESWSGRKRVRVFAEERTVTHADPCQARGVRLARECRGLVIHGPPGTGKSQTITNIIGDHLARGERVLMVCDKRTALDVVAHRLERLGLGGLFAVVHDARQDQRHLYKKLREQLENLTEARSDAWAEPKLNKIDTELERLHAELSEIWSLLMAKDAGGTSFHERAGQWLESPGPAEISIDSRFLCESNLAELEQHHLDVHDLLTRAAAVDYGNHPWKIAAGMSLEDFLGRPMSEVRAAMKVCLEQGQTADACGEVSIPFLPQPGLQEQGQARAHLAKEVEEVLAAGLARGVLGRWAGLDSEAVRRARSKLTAAEPLTTLVGQGPLDAELALQVQAEPVSLAEISRRLSQLETYLTTASKWYGWFCFRRRSQAFQVLSRHGLPPNLQSAQRLHEFLLGLRARLILQALYLELSGLTKSKAAMVDDDILTAALSALGKLLNMLATVRQPVLAGLEKPLADVLAEPSLQEKFLAGLKGSAARAEALLRLQQSLESSGLFAADWLAKAFEQWRNGQPATRDLALLDQEIGTLEGALRIRQGLERLPTWLAQAVENLCGRGGDAATGAATLRKMVLAAELTARLKANPTLQALDPQRLHTTFNRYRTLEQEKLALVRETIRHRWIGRQKERLLVGTGSRLNSLGADLGRRLTLRGDHALRLRQVITVGQAIEGGDPLFDLCPVWMASPETVAQIFPRQALFDVVIFDEASQCRLEEALPVLLRGRRVVIAGDPKQLPPTRFFESALAVSEEEEIDNDQQLFEAHQAEIEDLLGAALSIDVQQCYLDVHYRSRNADLIEFSNRQFYGSRLQPIPGHPSRRARFAPISLYRADGVYQDRTNPTEARFVCKIVRDLLKRAEPPSIGIACFNLSQRDLIVDELDALAQEDREFGRRLSEARVRQGVGSMEGLFVKNLENVQGDERDHMIISTTYGPDPSGRFYKRFGPLGRAGGGRRLNVLVTRARQEVHLVTSIPPSVYRGVPPVPAGQTPGGAWLLFSYLAYAEQLAEAYERAYQEQAESDRKRQAAVDIRPSESPSAFSAALAGRLATEHGIGGTVHWGNNGFCVDLALEHRHRPDDVTVGILCDGVRFAQAEDPIEWDLFRTSILEGQGWRIHRLWSPHFFRDPHGGMQHILRDVDGVERAADAAGHDE